MVLVSNLKFSNKTSLTVKPMSLLTIIDYTYVSINKMCNRFISVRKMPREIQKGNNQSKHF